MVPTIELMGYQELEKGLDDIIKYVKNPVKTMAEASMIMLQNINRHFQNEEGPNGKWIGLLPLTILNRRNKGAIKILQDAGELLISIKNAYTSTSAEAGTNKVYAPPHQYGFPKMNIPARKFAWLDDESQNRIVDRFIVGLKEA